MRVCISVASNEQDEQGADAINRHGVTRSYSVGPSENSTLGPFRRVGHVALRRSLSQQKWKFSRIDSRSIEAFDAFTWLPLAM
jgi:hypothetical protein